MHNQSNYNVRVEHICERNKCTIKQLFGHQHHSTDRWQLNVVLAVCVCLCVCVCVCVRVCTCVCAKCADCELIPQSIIRVSPSLIGLGLV